MAGPLHRAESGAALTGSRAVGFNLEIKGSPLVVFELQIVGLFKCYSSAFPNQTFPKFHPN